MALSASTALTIAALVCTALITLIRKAYRIGQREPLLPPGPPTKPLLGNLTILPREDVHLKYAEWAEQYGEIFSLKVASKTTIVLSSFDAVYEIMEKNGSITANRPRLAQVDRIFGDSTSFADYGPTIRKWRRAATDMTSPSACQKHMPLLLAETNQLMSDLLDHPDSFTEDIQRWSTSLSFAIIFGTRTPSLTSHDAQLFLRTSEEVFKLAAPGEVPPINLMPILYYIPDKYARNWKARSDAVKRDQEELWFRQADIVYKKLERGVSNGCLTEILIDRAKEWDLDRKTVESMSGNFLRASSHTTIIVIQWFLLLATVHQDAQEKLREEMDRVVGPSRAPDEKDLPNLPYLRAFIREVMRFRTVVPIGTAHIADEDQMYKGYLIPRGATLILNTWHILHDPHIYDDPNIFNPDRFINIDPSKADLYKKLDTLTFGVGRRICPGMFFSNRVLEVTAASLIWGFEFTPPAEGGLDENNFTTISRCTPVPFKCDIKPRSPEKAKIIKNNLQSSRIVLDQYAG